MPDRKPRTPSAVVRRAHERYTNFKTYAEVWRELKYDGAARGDDGVTPLYGFTTADVPSEKTIRNLLKNRSYDDPSDRWKPLDSPYSISDTRSILDVLRVVNVVSDGKVVSFSQKEAQTIRMIAGLATPKLSRLWVYILSCDFLAKSKEDDTTALEIYLSYIAEPNYDGADIDWLATYNEAVKRNLIPRLNLVWDSDTPGHIPEWVVHTGGENIPEGDQLENQSSELRKSVVKRNESVPTHMTHFDIISTDKKGRE